MQRTSWAFLGFAIVAASGCSSVKVQPRLDSSLGMAAFEQMREIQQHDVALALYLDPKLKDLKVQQSIEMGEFSFDMGSAFSAKLIKALAYNFRRIVLIDQPAYTGNSPVDAVMRVSLQGIDVNMGVQPGFTSVSTNAYSRLSVRAQIADAREKRIVWVGTTRAKEEGQHEEMARMTYQEAGRGFADAMNRVIDKAVGELAGDMSRSPGLRAALARWETHKGG